MAFLLGGAVQGGRVGGDWPGLSGTQLLEGRDLAPTTDLRAIAKGVLATHLGLGMERLGEVFPDSVHVRPMAGLVRT
ncbi:MAG: hypothetical protein ACRYG6_12380 [Janthinobacterium lividum]